MMKRMKTTTLALNTEASRTLPLSKINDPEMTTNVFDKIDAKKIGYLDLE